MKKIWCRYLRMGLFLLLFGGGASAQSPHGDGLKLDCAACHRSDSWDIPASLWTDRSLALPKTPSNTAAENSFFSHDDTNFPLKDSHTQTDCRSCHATLVFSEAEPDCISCHTDIHRMTVGDDCSRCHTTHSWLVDEVTQLHIENGFPLLGAHGVAHCSACHVSESRLEFNRIGNDCINCHQTDYASTTTPNHQNAGFSTNCLDCHRVDAFDWSAQNILHDFFPLTGGHDIQDCSRCHTTPDFSMTPTECIACHQTDFQEAQNPNHISSQFPTNCNVCHSTAPGWRPASLANHDEQYFPINSGNHRGEWNECIDCHTTPGNYVLFSCTDCHEHNNANELARDHEDVNGYMFQSSACYACHPNGDE